MSNLKNKLQHFIEGQIPEYFRATKDFKKFVDFIKEYYKFLDENRQVNSILLNSHTWSDVDLTLDLFVTELRKQYAYDISPEALVEHRRLIKFINQYYESKGTENAAELYFRMMYNDTATVKYPGDYVLRASDGIWTAKKTVKIDTNFSAEILNPDSLELAPAALRTSATDAFSLKEKTIYFKYNRREITGLNTYSLEFGCVNVGRIITNQDIFELEINIPSTSNVKDINEALSTLPYYDTVWVTAFEDGVEYVYGHLTQQLVGYTILSGGENFRRRDTFEIEVEETPLYPITIQANNNGIVRVNNVTESDVEEYFATDYVSAGLDYAVSDIEGIINSLRFISTGHRFDITGDYFSEIYNENDNYTTYKDFVRVLDNPRGSRFSTLVTGDYFAEREGSDSYMEFNDDRGYVDYNESIFNISSATVRFDVGYIFEHPGKWKNNAGFLSDINKLQDNYYYQPYSYVIQTKNVPYEKWNTLYKNSAHPAGFAVFGELLVEHSIQFTPISITSTQFYINNFIDNVQPLDEIVIDFYKQTVDGVSTSGNYAPEYFAEEYTPGDELTWLLEKPIDNEIDVDDADYNFEIGKNILGLSTAILIDTNVKDMEAVYVDIIDAEDVFDREVNFIREFTDNDGVTDNQTVDYLNIVTDDSFINEEFDRVVNYIRVFDELETVSDSQTKNIEKAVIDDNGYNIQGYFLEDYTDVVSVITTDELEVEISISQSYLDAVDTTENVLIESTTAMDNENIVIIEDNAISYNKTVGDNIVVVDSMERNIDQNNDAQSDLLENIGIEDFGVITYSSEKLETVFIDSDPVLSSSKVTTDNVITSSSISQFSYNKAVSEFISNIETISKVTNKTLSETIILSDTVLVTIGRDLFETIAVNDASIITYGKNVVDSSTLIDTNVKNINKVVVSSQYTSEVYFAQNYNYDDSENTIILSDVLTAQISKPLSDVITGITDSSNITLNHILTDNVVMSDGIFYNKLENDDPQSDLSEQLTFSDTRNFLVIVSKTETVVSTDQLQKQVSRPASDTISRTDSTTISSGKSLSELETVIDTKIISVNKNSSDITILTDVDVFTLNKPLTDTVIESDFISIGESKNVSEALTGTDSAAKLVNRPVSDTFTKSDANAKHFFKPIDGTYYTVENYFQETYVFDTSENVVNAADIAAKNIGKPISDTVSRSDAITTKNVGKNTSETILTSETFVKNISDVIIDTFTKSDTTTKFVGKTLTDTGTLTDVLIKSLLRGASDTFNSSDVLSKLVQKSLNDSITGVSDTSTRSYGKNISDTVGKTDSITKNISDNLADTVGKSDALVKNISDNLADTVGKTDSITKNISDNLADTFTKSDSNAKHFYKPIDGTYYTAENYFQEIYVFDTSDNVVDTSDIVIRHPNKVVTDSITRTDSNIITLNKVFTDVIISSEVLHYHHLQNNDELSDLADNNHATDVLNVSLNINKTDTVAKSDSVAKSSAKPISDTVSRSDAITTKNVGKNTSETILTSETFVKNISDNLADTFTKSDTLAKSVSKPLTETSTITDSISSIVFRALNLADTFTKSDTLTKTVQKSLADTFTKSDSITKNISDNLADTLTGTDVLVKNISDNLADTFTKSDSITKNISDVLTDTVGKSDALVKSINDNLADTFTKSDSITKNISDVLTDTVGKTDSITKNISDNLADTVGKSDALVKSINDNLADTFTKSDSIAKNINSGTKVETVSSTDSPAKNFSKLIDGAVYNEQNYFAETYVTETPENIADVNDTMTLVNQGYAGAGYVTDGYATETRTV